MTGYCPEKVISGGQTGVDQGALEVALAHNVQHGGWCPPGRISEDGVIPVQFLLQEVPPELFAEHDLDPNSMADAYRLRTRLNVKDADATLILCRDPTHLSPGSRLTKEIARGLQKPCILLSTEDEDVAWRIETWLRDMNVRTLNVAGTRESKTPGIQARTVQILEIAFGLNVSPCTG